MRDQLSKFVNSKAKAVLIPEASEAILQSDKTTLASPRKPMMLFVSLPERKTVSSMGQDSLTSKRTRQEMEGPREK